MGGKNQLRAVLVQLIVMKDMDNFYQSKRMNRSIKFIDQ